MKPEEKILKNKIGFVSLGCPKNLTVTETMIGLLAPDYEIVTKGEALPLKQLLLKVAGRKYQLETTVNL